LYSRASFNASNAVKFLRHARFAVALGRESPHLPAASFAFGALPSRLSGVFFKTMRPTTAGRHAKGVARFPDFMEAGMATGTIKWFNAQKGYGFIQPDAGGKDVFVHISAVERAGLPGLNEGQKIQYEIVRDRGKEAAGNLSLVG
jgi:cold shock protein